MGRVTEPAELNVATGKPLHLETLWRDRTVSVCCLKANYGGRREPTYSLPRFARFCHQSNVLCGVTPTAFAAAEVHVRGLKFRSRVLIVVCLFHGATGLATEV